MRDEEASTMSSFLYITLMFWVGGEREEAERG